MMERLAFFDRLRALKPDGKFQPVDVALLDQLADELGIARAAPAAAPGAATSVVPDDYWPLLARIESGNRPYVKAATSSGSGLYQFLKATWIGEGGAWGADLSQAFGGLRPSADEQTMRAKSFTAKNAAVLRARGIPINKASLYAAHFFGAEKAAEVIGADVTARADLIAGPAATKANPSILKGKTVGQFLAWLHDKTGDWAR